MQCPECEHENLGDSLFCTECGALQRELREAHRLFTEMGATGHAERLAKELKGTRVSKRKSVAQKPRAKGKTKAVKPGRKAKPKATRQPARRKSKK